MGYVCFFYQLSIIFLHFVTAYFPPFTIFLSFFLSLCTISPVAYHFLSSSFLSPATSALSNNNFTFPNSTPYLNRVIACTQTSSNPPPITIHIAGYTGEWLLPPRAYRFENPCTCKWIANPLIRRNETRSLLRAGRCCRFAAILRIGLQFPKANNRRDSGAVIAISASNVPRNPPGNDWARNRVNCEGHVRQSFVTRRSAIHEAYRCQGSKVKTSMERIRVRR